MKETTATMGDRPVRFINCYGNQEKDSETIRKSFFAKLNEDIEMAKASDNLICIETDANGKLGKSIISGDPHEMSPNGKLLNEIIERHDLVVVNATAKCSGVITRRNVTSIRTEQSVLDYFIVYLAGTLHHHYII